MNIRPATLADLPTMLALFANARSFMWQTGNTTQWTENYPSEALLRDDIQQGTSYVCLSDHVIQGTFVLLCTPDPTYANIEGAWCNDLPYGTLHRIASSGQVPKLTDAIVAWASEQMPSLRGDTHEDNIPMRNAFERNGFQYCGTIICANGTPRRAYHRP